MPDREIDLLIERVARCASMLRPLRCKAYRSSRAPFANNRDLLTGRGADLNGGRWNRRGIAAVYASLSLTTALAEALSHTHYYQLAADQALPRTFCGIEVRLRGVLDLTEGRTRQRLQFSLDDMLDEDWRRIMADGDEAWTQVLGRGASQAGIEALIAPSAADRPNGINLVVFTGNLQPGSRVRILRADQLPDPPPT